MNLTSPLSAGPPETSPHTNARIYLIGQDGELCKELVKIMGEVDGVTIAQHDAIPAPTANFTADYVLVVAEDEPEAIKTLTACRTSRQFGLTPLILLAPKEPEAGAVPLYDAYLSPGFSPFVLKSTLKTLAAIAARLRQLPPLSPTLAEKARREVNLLRFIYCRELPEIIPGRDKNSPWGYSLPWADALLGLDKGRGLPELNHMAAEGLFSFELLDKVNVCPRCRDYRINFRQVCPHCGSPDIGTQETIQHFSCAYVGPEKNFVQRDKFICPKCSKELKHIGVDYTKAGTVAVCEHCGQVSEEPEVSCLSLVCGEVFPPDQAHQNPIYRLQLSPLGEEAAKEGLHADSEFNNVLKSFLNIYSFAFFEKFFELEVKRSLRYQHPFSLIKLHLTNRHDIEGRIGLQQKASLVRELEEILGTSLRDTDLITLAPDGNLFLLLIECDRAQAEAVVGRILAQTNKVLAVPLEFQYHISCLSDQAPDLESLQQLLHQPDS